MDITHMLAEEFGQTEKNTANVLRLIDDGNTIPFIARYRKEMTGNMDDQLLRELYERLIYLRNLQSRREEIVKSIKTLGKLDEHILEKLDRAVSLAQLEDIYRPYRPKRKTRASVALEKGLAPLAARIIRQIYSDDPMLLAKDFIDPEKLVKDEEEALSGARDIIAEHLSDNADIRAEIKLLSEKKAELSSKAAKDEDSVYRMYYDFTESISSLPSHRILAINRGEKEGYLKVSVSIPQEQALSILRRFIVRNDSPCAMQVNEAVEDGWTRLMQPSISRELRGSLTEKANAQAIRTFALNLRPLLMQPPVKNKITMGFDPGYRTGCKLAVVDGTGKVLDTAVIYPTPPQSKIAEARKKVCELIDKYRISVVSIGNGTAGRESERFIASIAEEKPIQYAIVSEAGASVYSASKLAAEEFPDYDVSLRSAVSIARRLQDPLSELVKIDPKSIGVGQYQHDIPAKQLDEALEGVVESCVNSVGVDLNTASVPLLSHIAGLNEAISVNIVKYREEKGAFSNRKELLKIAKLGNKTFEQCAGFLRIPESENMLDNTGVHPESYSSARKVLELCGYSEEERDNNGFFELLSRAKEYGLDRLASDAGVGRLTLTDIINELMRPGRDPRDELPPTLLRSDVMELSDLIPGMELTGTVRNIVDFGAFVDIGVHQDGLLHISKISQRFIRHPSEVLKTGDVITVYVNDIDIKKQRISLSMTPEQNQ